MRESSARLYGRIYKLQIYKVAQRILKLCNVFSAETECCNLDHHEMTLENNTNYLCMSRPELQRNSEVIQKYQSQYFRYVFIFLTYRKYCNITYFSSGQEL